MSGPYGRVDCDVVVITIVFPMAMDWCYKASEIYEPAGSHSTKRGTDRVITPLGVR